MVVVVVCRREAEQKKQKGRSVSLSGVSIFPRSYGTENEGGVHETEGEEGNERETTGRARGTLPCYEKGFSEFQVARIRRFSFSFRRTRCCEL